MRRAVAAIVFVWMAASSAAADGLEAHDYLLNCSGCHRASGLGSTTVPSLDRLAELPTTPEARRYLVQVPGVAQAPLSDARLAELLNWLVLRFTGTAPSPLFGASEVGELRRSPFLDPRAARARLITGAD